MYLLLKKHDFAFFLCFSYDFKRLSCSLMGFHSIQKDLQWFECFLYFLNTLSLVWLCFTYIVMVLVRLEGFWNDSSMFLIRFHRYDRFCDISHTFKWFCSALRWFWYDLHLVSMFLIRFECNCCVSRARWRFWHPFRAILTWCACFFYVWALFSMKILCFTCILIDLGTF